MAEVESDDRRKALLEQLKKARVKRGPMNREILDRRRAHDEIQNSILKALEAEAMTVPQIAEITGIDCSQVFWHVNALRKYNLLQEEKRRGDYTFYLKK